MSNDNFASETDLLLTRAMELLRNKYKTESQAICALTSDGACPIVTSILSAFADKRGDLRMMP